MILVRTKLDKSSIAGIGLFADEAIKAGTVVWKFQPKLDLLLAKDEVDELSDAAKEQFLNYAYFDESYGKYVLCGDDSRFFNHSDDPNCANGDGSEDTTVAVRYIEKGEELTCNYKTFYRDFHLG